MVYNVFLSSVLFQRKISMEPKHTKYMKETPGRLGGLSPPHWVNVSFPCLLYFQPSNPFHQPKQRPQRSDILLRTFSFIKNCFKWFQNPPESRKNISIFIYFKVSFNCKHKELILRVYIQSSAVYKLLKSLYILWFCFKKKKNLRTGSCVLQKNAQSYAAVPLWSARGSGLFAW